METLGLQKGHTGGRLIRQIMQVGKHINQVVGDVGYSEYVNMNGSDQGRLEN